MDNATSQSQNYTVVARRYRPKTFQELIGQDHIAQALGKAISAGRVGHAYLFTGARGVGKTSTARIFAKALNVGETTSALASVDDSLAEDISKAIDAGDDMDVIEIDGASNRGIEEIRQLRANVNVRPSRARYKIYIIDEVHMLTNQAFNALLKTLEEPPAHVKFIFCTTDPDKIPITVLSRCQRFDFAPVRLEQIQQRLKEISQAEGYQVDEEALALLARRAAGSMRDSQSLLEQVMSFSSDRITVDQVHALLGTADEGHLLALAQTLRDCDSLKALGLIDEALRGGADPGQLAEQLLNYLRDVMAVGVGGGPSLLKLANPAGHEMLKALAASWGVQTILSAIQILDESLVRMRTSVSAATLLEVAAVQICQLASLASIPVLLEAVRQGAGATGENTHRPPRPAAAQPIPQYPPPTSEKKNAEVAVAATVPAPHFSVQPALTAPTVPAETPVNANPAPHSSSTQSSMLVAAAGSQDGRELATVSPSLAVSSRPPHSTAVDGIADHQPATTSATALAEWRRAVSSIDGMLADFAALAEAVEPQGSDRWHVIFPPGVVAPCEYCENATRRAELQDAVAKMLGRTIHLSFAVKPGEVPKPSMATPQAAIRAKKAREIAEHPFIKQICEILDGEVIRVDSPVAKPS
ncbi:MAG: DNA polymerase III subunit gamma/tau [Pirellulaceae bacterium]